MKSNLILATRSDGLGERLRAILNGIYITKRLGMEFGFVWHPLNPGANKIANNNLAPIVVPPQEKIFSQEFIEKYSYNGKYEDVPDEFGRFKRQSVEVLKKYSAWNPPYRVTQKRLDTIFSDVKTKEYKMALVKIWEEIDFCGDFKKYLLMPSKKH